MKRKLLSLLALLMTAATGAWADTTVTITGDNLSDNEDAPSFTIEGVTVTNTSGDAIIANVLEGTLTFSTELGNFTEIVINADEITESDWGGSTWTGNASSVSLEGLIYGISSIVFTISPTVVANGNCGTSDSDVTWSLTSDGVLTISGSGAMADYGNNTMPWMRFRSSSSATTLITSIVIGNGVTAIGNYAFQGCSKATSISIPNSVTSIGYKAFYSCKKLETIDIPASVTTIESNAFEKCSGLKSVDIPASVTSISSSAFYGCTGLTSVSIPASVTSISSSAFKGCTSLTSIDIPASVTNIESNVFDGCSNLKSVNLYRASPCTAYPTTFANCPVLEIHVFSDYVDAYQDATNWSDFAEIITPISVTANEGTSGVFWATYYNSLVNVQVPEGTQVFKVNLEGTGLTLTEIEGRVIKKGEGVVLKSNTDNITLAPAESASGDYTNNSLTGTMTSIANPGNAYVLNKTATNGVGFYKLSESGTIGDHKAYLTYDGSAGVRGFFLFDEATGISLTPNPSPVGEGSVYDLQGRRVSQPAKGLYIVNGKKYLKK